MAKPTLNSKRLLVVHAHPDDESLFTGHLIAERVAAGAEVMVLTLTRGERGRVKLDEIKSLEGKLESMGYFRANELLNAIAAFGPTVKHKFAGTRAYLDSGMRINALGRPTRKRILDEMSLVAVATPVIADDIVAVMKSFRPDAVITYNRKGGFGHPDHKKAYEATSMAIRKYSKDHRAPQFWTIAEPGEHSDVKVGGVETAAVKKAALSAHASQVLVMEDSYALVAGKEIRYDAPEKLRRASVSSWNSIKPWLRSVWALPLGWLDGLAGTMLHLTRTVEGVPIGLIVALVMTAALGVALRVLRRSRGALYLSTLAFIITVLQLSQPQPDGSAFMDDSELSTYWVYGSIALLAIIIVFPRI
ncbi:MAG: hypothetical protein RL545_74, partial [Actinomycetota bacterium]